MRAKPSADDPKADDSYVHVQCRNQNLARIVLRDVHVKELLKPARESEGAVRGSVALRPFYILAGFAVGAVANAYLHKRGCHQKSLDCVVHTLFYIELSL